VRKRVHHLNWGMNYWKVPKTRVTEVNLNTFNQPFAPQLSQQTVVLNDGDFVEPKESKKNKKHAAKVNPLVSPAIRS
jgi:hypothetical protein